MRILIFAAMAAALLVGCSSTSDDDGATATPADSTPAATATARATEAPRATNTPAPTATATPNPKPKIGVTTEAKGSKYTVNEVRDNLPAVRFSAPKAGMRWVAIDVTQEGTATGPDSVNPFYFSVQDDAAFVYGYGFVPGAPEPTLTSGQLSAGQKVRGWIGFEVPAAAKLISVLVQPDPLGGTVIIADLTQ